MMNFRYNTKSTAHKRKKKPYQLDFIKIKNCSVRHAIKRKKRQATDQDRIIVKHMFYEGLVSKIYKEFLHLSSKKTTQLKTGKRSELKKIDKYEISM